MPRTLAKLSSGKRVLGFTLLEVLMVAAAILILVAIGVPNFVSALKRAKMASAKVQLLSYKAALQQYHTDTRRYPPSGSEHFYYALSGLFPFNQKSSTRYNPPYHDFDATLIGNPPPGSQDFDYSVNPIELFPSPTSANTRPLGLDEIRRPSAEFGTQIPFRPVIDPWGRPVVYISPDDLLAWWNWEPTAWANLIGVSDETRFNDKGIMSHVPFDMNLGQFWSAGPDGRTAENNPGETDFGYFTPGNLLPDDGRNNDRLLEQAAGIDAMDAADNRAKGINQIAEDDVSSW